MKWTPEQTKAIEAIQQANPGLDIHGAFKRVSPGDLAAILLNFIVKQSSGAQA